MHTEGHVRTQLEDGHLQAREKEWPLEKPTETLILAL